MKKKTEKSSKAGKNALIQIKGLQKSAVNFKPTTDGDDPTKYVGQTDAASSLKPFSSEAGHTPANERAVTEGILSGSDRAKRRAETRRTMRSDSSITRTAARRTLDVPTSRLSAVMNRKIRATTRQMVSGKTYGNYRKLSMAGKDASDRIMTGRDISGIRDRLATGNRLSAMQNRARRLLAKNAPKPVHPTLVGVRNVRETAEMDIKEAKIEKIYKPRSKAEKANVEKTRKDTKTRMDDINRARPIANAMKGRKTTSQRFKSKDIDDDKVQSYANDWNAMKQSMTGKKKPKPGLYDKDIARLRKNKDRKNKSDAISDFLDALPAVVDQAEKDRQERRQRIREKLKAASEKIAANTLPPAEVPTLPPVNVPVPAAKMNNSGYTGPVPIDQINNPDWVPPNTPGSKGMLRRLIRRFKGNLEKRLTKKIDKIAEDYIDEKYEAKTKAANHKSKDVPKKLLAAYHESAAAQLAHVVKGHQMAQAAQKAQAAPAKPKPKAKTATKKKTSNSKAGTSANKPNKNNTVKPTRGRPVGTGESGHDLVIQHGKFKFKLRKIGGAPAE